MTFPAEILSHTPKKIQFELMSDTDRIICDSEPINWKSGTLELKRDLEAGGVFVNYQQDSLTFVGNGAVFLRNLYDSFELTSRAKCTLIISYWKEFDLTTPANSRQYVEFPSRFEINFAFYETVKIGRFWFGVRVKAVNNSVQTKLDNRIDVDVDISKVIDAKITTIGGIKIDSYGSDDNMLKKGIDFAATNIIYFSELNWSQIGHGVLLDRITGTASYTAMPLSKVGLTGEFPEIQSVGYQTRIVNIANITPFFKSAKFDYNSIDIYYHWNTIVNQRHIGDFNWRIQIVEIDPAGTIYATHYEKGFGGINQYYSDEGTITISIKKGNDLKFVCKNQGYDNTTAYTEIQDLKITQTVSQSPAITGEGLPIYETIERLCQHDLDVRYPIYSDFFGRQDVQYRPNVYYATESVDRFAHVMGGMNLRGALLNNPDAPIVLNFKNLMKSIKALWNVGYSLETNLSLFGDPLPRIRIEEYAHFFENVKIDFNPPLSSRINKYDIQSQVMPELVPVDLKSGFESFEYLTANGRAEPNTTSQRTSAMNTATKFEAISWLRGDTKGIYDNISNPIGVNGSTDTKGDGSVFIIKSRKHLTSTVKWIPETDQSITVRHESSLFKNALLNRYFTPTRILIRHINRIKAGMMKLNSDSVLKFQASDKSNSLETSTDGGVTSLFENQDLIISSLANPIYKAIKHTAIMIFTRADLALAIAYPYRYWDFGTDLKGNNVSGFLLNLKQQNLSDKAEITIIERFVP